MSEQEVREMIIDYARRIRSGMVTRDEIFKEWDSLPVSVQGKIRDTVHREFYNRPPDQRPFWG